MAVSTPFTRTHESGESPAWESLRRAISTSSGFQRWQQQSGDRVQRKDTESDQLVVEYLRETLETLAY